MSENNSDLIERIAKKFSQCNGTDPQIVRALREFERHIHIRMNLVFSPEAAPEREPGAPAARAFNASGELPSAKPERR